MHPVPIIKGEQIIFVDISSSAKAMVGFVKYTDKRGRAHKLPKVEWTSGSTRVPASKNSKSFPADGLLQSVTVHSTETGIKRGQIFIRAEVRQPEGGKAYPELMHAYYHDERPVEMGMFEDSLSGRGHLNLLTIANDVAGDTDATLAINITNALRVLKAIVLYYHASASAANSNPNLIIDSAATGIYGALPTGFTIGSATEGRIFREAGPTLGANEEGIMFYGENARYTAFADNTNPTRENNTTAPYPFPLTVTEEMDIRLKTTIGSGHADDRYSAYALVEEWIDV